MKKKIFSFITTTRADYDLLSLLLKKISKIKTIKLNLVVSGTHFEKDFGYSYKNIIDDGLKINKKIKLNINNKNSSNLFKSNSLFFYELSKHLIKTKPFCVVLLGDRLEILISAIVAHTLNIPIIHIGGGELTFGSTDDSFRHSITKMSALHCVSNKKYKKRLIQLGENPKNIYITGDPSNELILNEKLLTVKDLEKKFKVKFLKNNILFTFHPETLNLSKVKVQIKKILYFLSKLENTLIIFTYPNNDLNSKYIISEIKKFIKKNQNSYLLSNLGRKNYFSFLKNVDLVIGNSSSGLTEAPQFFTPTLNIGERQNGRIKEMTVFDSDYKIVNLISNYNKIIKNISNKNFKKIKLINNIKNFSDNFLIIIKNLKSNININKKFYDL